MTPTILPAVHSMMPRDEMIRLFQGIAFRGQDLSHSKLIRVMAKHRGRFDGLSYWAGSFPQPDRIPLFYITHDDCEPDVPTLPGMLEREVIYWRRLDNPSQAEALASRDEEPTGVYVETDVHWKLHYGK